MVIIKVKDFGDIKIELDYKNAKNTCANFVSLARNHFYDELTFHRVIKGFMIQGGDPKGNGTGGPGYSIKGEFKQNGYNNTLSHERGVISMARAMDFNSAGSQFFIMHKDGKYLDGQYASFGRVIEGIEVVDKIARVRTSPNDRPYENVVIEKMIVEDEEDLPVEKM
ncbi:MAG: peptidylprolyl isomerase [Bacilli bacterium]|nr:peptidylprolyl isomerase [Bacillales bacterium]MDY2575016.1 peptidylprolyl isomerase [Bacilli bacterium]